MEMISEIGKAYLHGENDMIVHPSSGSSIVKFLRLFSNY